MRNRAFPKRLKRRECLRWGAGLAACWLGGSALPAWSEPVEVSQATQEEFPPGRWVLVHRQRPADEVRFRRQAHGGSCLDVHRDRLILFGSDTHGRDWTNSPLCFDLKRRRWYRLYPNDPFQTYTVTPEGIPVAGRGGNHPWAMHTFGAVVYDSARQEMIVASAPRHMVPGRFTDKMRELWPRVKRFPTWVLDCRTDRWRPLPCEPVNFFPHSIAYDSHRKAVLGFRPNGIFRLGGEPRRWERLTGRVFLRGWHNNCVYDSKHQALVVFGKHTNSNQVEVYHVAEGRHRVVPVRGDGPRPDQHNPMAFHQALGKTVVLVDYPGRSKNDPGRTETWLFDLAEDRWSRVASAVLPFPCGMNYNMEYDPRRKLLWLVTGGYRQATCVWALRLPET